MLNQSGERPEPFTAETAEPAEAPDVLCALGELGGEGLLDSSWTFPQGTDQR